MDNNQFHADLSYLSSSYSTKLNAIYWYSTIHTCISYNVWMHATVYISTHAKYVNIWYMKKSESESVSHSVVSDSVTPWAVALQAPLSMEFSRQEYWSGFHSLLQGIFLTQRSNRIFCIEGRFFTIWATREALYGIFHTYLFIHRDR